MEKDSWLKNIKLGYGNIYETTKRSLHWWQKVYRILFRKFPYEYKDKVEDNK